jgi:hypothetical protein
MHHHHNDEDRERCEACGNTVEPDRPRTIWRVAVAGAWIACLLLCGATVLSSIMMIVVAPVVLFIGMFLLAVTHAEAFHPAHCPACGAAMFPKPAEPVHGEERELPRDALPA